MVGTTSRRSATSFPDLVQPTAAAWACPNTVDTIDTHDLLDLLETRWQRTAVGLAQTIGFGPDRSSFTPRTGCAKCRPGFLNPQLELVGIELLGLAAETMAHKSIDDRLQPLDPSFCLALCNRHIGKLAGLLKGERA